MPRFNSTEECIVKKALYLSLALAWPLSSWALPSLTNKCGEKGINIRLPLDSDIVVYDKECQTVFVGPPSAGTAEVVSAIPSANLSFCPSVKTLPNVVNKLMASIDHWMERITTSTNEVLALEKERDGKRATLIEYEEKNSALDTQLAKKQEELAEIAKELKEAKTQLNNCRALNDNASNCANLENEVLEIKRKYIDFRQKNIDSLEQEISEVNQKARILNRKLKQVMKNLEESVEIFETTKKRLNSLKNEALESYATFGALEGITAQILFESNWQEQIEYVKRNNRHSGLHVTALPLIKSTIEVDSANNALHSNINLPPSLLYANLPGFTESGALSSPNGENKISTLEAEPGLYDSLLSGASGKVILSLIGSCAFTDDHNKIKRDLNFKDIASHITINTINEYPILVGRRHTVHFRAYRFAEEIEKRTEKGGFFRTESIHEIIKNNYSRDDFQIDFDSDPGANGYTDAEKATLTAEAKKEIIDRVLSEIGTVYELATKRPIEPAHIRRSGAGLIFDETPCLGWKFCYVGKFVIGVLDSIFGRKDAVTKFKANNYQRVSYLYSDSKPTTYNFTTTFRPKG
jgi:hypothetical protein